MSELKDCTAGVETAPSGEGCWVSLEVPDDHPVMQLKRALPWEAISEVMVRNWRAAGKNVDGGPGQPWPVSLYVPLLVLMQVKRLNSREMEWYVDESAVARVFLGMEHETSLHIRDHANIARALAALGREGVEAVNGLVIGEAVKRGFGDPQVLSADTTVQELPIGYPHEAGIVRGIAQRCRRAAAKLVKAGVKVVEGVVEAAGSVLRSVKEYHLFAKTKEEKDGILKRLLVETEGLMEQVNQVTQCLAKTSVRVMRAGVEQLQRMQQVTTSLLPQIRHWMETGKVAAGKILHAGLPEARAYVRHKAGKPTEFGVKYLINRIGGGYVFGDRVTQHNDSGMPVKALKHYRKLFGRKAKPEMCIYDRGGFSSDTVKKLQKAGIAKIGIQPKGQAAWLVAEADRATVTSQRGQMEGSIGTLKSTAYGFNRPKERALETVLRAGQCSFLALNLNLFVKDLTQPKRLERRAAA